MADSGNALIRRIDPQGNVQTVSGKLSDETRVDGPFAQATYWRPRYLRVDHDDRLYVLDDGPYIGKRGARIRRLDFSTGEVTIVARGLHDVVAAWVYQFAQEPRREALAGPGFAAERKDRIWTRRTKCGQDPQNGETKLIFSIKWQKPA